MHFDFQLINCSYQNHVDGELYFLICVKYIDTLRVTLKTALFSCQRIFGRKSLTCPKRIRAKGYGITASFVCFFFHFSEKKFRFIVFDSVYFGNY